MDYSDHDKNSVDSRPSVTPTNLYDMAQRFAQGMDKDQKLWMQYHYNLKHLPNAHVCKLAEAGIIPRKLAKITPPVHIGCLKGKQHRCPWRGRGKQVRTIRQSQDNFPGARTSTDQMYSQVGGLIPQVRGILTKAWYRSATVFVDHYTDYMYVHLMTNTEGDTTLAAKNAYEYLLL